MNNRQMKTRSQSKTYHNQGKTEDQALLELECLRLSSDGSGIGYQNGKATFVAGLLPNEIGQIHIEEGKKNWQRGSLQSIIKKSEDRVEPPCTVFSICGGCQLQHLNYAQTLEWKKRWVEDSLTRIGRISLDKVKVHPTIGMDEPWRYRNKARMHLGEEGILGYHREKSNSTVRFSDCLLISESLNHWIRKVEDFLAQGEYPEVRAVTFRENSQGEVMVILDSVHNQDVIKESLKLKEDLSQLQAIWGIDKKGKPQLLYGEETFTEDILGIEFNISPLAFLQVNPIQTRKLYQTALDWAGLTPDQVVWDLYSGIGTITLALAAEAKKVWGIEENPYAVEDARKNAKHNHIDNVEFISGKVEDTFLQITERPDIVVLDPPRAGAHRSVLERLIELEPNRLVYISCDPGTLARDLGILQAGGYEVIEVQPVDLFPWTMHVEAIVKLERR